MADSRSREAAWDAVHEALPARWHVGPVRYDPGRRVWVAADVGPHPGRGKIPQSVEGTGEDEAAALRGLDDRLRGVPRPDGGQMTELERRLRLAYLSGAEERSVTVVGRGLTLEEVARVLERYAVRDSSSLDATSTNHAKR